MAKRILLIAFLIIGAFVVYLQHLIVYDARFVNIVGKTYNLENKFPVFYTKYFFFRDQNPIYVWKGNTLGSYQKQCFEKKENCIVMPHQDFEADLMWLGSIQYIGTVLDASKAPYLYAALDNLTNLSPFWNYPYVFGVLMTPIPKNDTTSETIDLATRKNSRGNSVKLGEKGIYFNCDKNKIDQIKKLSNKEFFEAVQGKIIDDNGKNLDVPQNDIYKKLKNPCKNADLPAFLAFNYFYYLGDWQNSSDYYKIASFQDEAAPVNANMVALVSGRSGQHIKSMNMWFTRFISLIDKYNTLTAEDERKIYESKFVEAIKKAIFEYQLDLLTQLDSNSNGVCKHDYDCMLKKGILKEKIFEETTTCQKYDIKYDIASLSKQITDNDEAYTTKVKCLMLAYSIQNKLIMPENGSFEYPFNYLQKEKEKFSFNYNTDTQDWRIAIKE